MKKTFYLICFISFLTIPNFSHAGTSNSLKIKFDQAIAKCQKSKPLPECYDDDKIKKSMNKWLEVENFILHIYLGYTVRLGSPQWHEIEDGPQIISPCTDEEDPEILMKMIEVAKTFDIKYITARRNACADEQENFMYDDKKYSTTTGRRVQ